MNDIRYRRNPAAIWRASASFLVAAVPPLPPTRVSGSAGLVWSLLDEPLTTEEIVAKLVAATGADAAIVRGDTESLFDDLVPMGLIEELPPCTP